MTDIFLSYNREDQVVARQFADGFARAGLDVWWDVSLRSGEAYDEVTETALRSAKAVVVLWSPRSVASRWVRAEATIALRNDTFVPVTIAPCERPVMFELTQTADLTGWRGEAEHPGWLALLDDLKLLIADENGAKLPSLPAARAAARLFTHHPSIAVLPFSDLSNDPEQGYFVQGMMEEVAAALTRIRILRVLSSESSLALVGKVNSLTEIARTLKAHYLLQGSVRWSGSQVRIALHLVDGASGAQIWSDRFDDELEHIFDLQERIARKVASIVEPSVHEAELRRATRQPLESLDCYDLYLRASALRAACKADEVLSALDLLERALELDPEFAPALAQAAGCHSQVYYNDWSEDRELHRRRGIERAERAAANGADDASVLAQAANALFDLDPNTSRARALAERATSLNPSCARAWFMSGLLCVAEGKADEALARLEMAAALDPVSPLNDIVRVQIGFAKAIKRDFVGSLDILRATTHRTARIHLILAAIYGHAHKEAECQAEYERFRATSGLTAKLTADQFAAVTPNAAVQRFVIKGLRLGLGSARSDDWTI